MTGRNHYHHSPLFGPIGPILEQSVSPIHLKRGRRVSWLISLNESSSDKAAAAAKEGREGAIAALYRTRLCSIVHPLLCWLIHLFVRFDRFPSI